MVRTTTIVLDGVPDTFEPLRLITWEQYLKVVIEGQTILTDAGTISPEDGPFGLAGDTIINRGGKGSGHHDHKGRPGKRGGSAPSGAREALPGYQFFHSEKFQAALRVAEEEIRDLNHEVGIILDTEGNEVFRKVGGQDSVEFTREETEQYLRGGFLIHNHPSGGALSDGDVGFFGLAQLWGVRAVHNGWNSTLYWGDAANLEDTETLKDIASRFPYVQSATFRHYVKRHEAGEFHSARHASWVHISETLESFQTHYPGLIYEWAYTPDPEAEKAWQKMYFPD